MKMAKSYEVDNKLPNMIGNGTKIIGDIETKGDIRIDGSIEGNIVSKGKVVIGVEGSVKGQVECVNAEVSGSIEGSVNILELLSLKESSKLNGSIKTTKLSIEPGAVFSGECEMGGNPINKKVNDLPKNGK